MKTTTGEDRDPLPGDIILCGQCGRVFGVKSNGTLGDTMCRCATSTWTIHPGIQTRIPHSPADTYLNS